MDAVENSRRRAVQLDANLTVPPIRSGIVGRPAAVKRLIDSPEASLVVLAAPAGYGKTSLLAEWVASDQRPFGWVSVGRCDNDAAVLASHVAAALDPVVDVDSAVLDVLDGGDLASVPAAVAMLRLAVATAPAPFVLVLDGGGELDSAQSLAVIESIIDELPAGSQLAISGRSESRMATAGLRAAGRLLELGATEMAFDTSEAAALLKAEGLDMGESEAVELVDRTEGWPAGIYLAAR